MSRSNRRVLLSVFLCVFLPVSGQGQELGRDINVTQTSPSPEPLVSKMYNLKSAIAWHAEASKLSLEEAKAEAIAQLFLVPRAKTVVEHNEVRPGEFEVVAPEWFHEHLTAMANWMASGEKQISM